MGLLKGESGSLLFALGAALCWGVWGFLSSRASEHSGPISLWIAVVLVEAIAIIPIVTVVKPSFSWAIVGAGVFGAAGYGLYFMALRHGTGGASLIALTALYPAVTLLLQVVIQGRATSPRQIIGVGLAVVAIWVIAG
ncbi:MAG: EamA family transporter [Ferrimicrobium sp.]